MKYEIYNEDCFTKLKELGDNSVDAIVTDPPYFISFMNKGWDKEDGIASKKEFWAECLRVTKPGGYLLAFGHSRTHHRLFTAVEDGGWEIRDTIMWLYGSGFPKSKNLSDGSGTALKPAHEPICMGRKPLEGTVAQNVSKWGVGGINIDACRIAGESKNTIGRFPANIILDEEAGALLDKQSGITKTKADLKYKHNKTGSDSEIFKSRGTYTPRADEGGASRFFYCAKISRKEKGKGNDHPTVKPIALMEYLIKLVSKEGHTILDPFMGSGSTGISAIKLNRDFVGIELDKNYYKISSTRLENIKGE